MKKINKLLILALLPILLIGTIVFFQNKDRLGARTDSGITIWGDIIGDISEQTDLTALIASIDSLTTTFTNKRITPRIGSIATTTSLTIDSNIYDQYYITGLEATTTIAVSGTPTNGQKLLIGIKASSTAQGLTFSTSSFATSSDLDLPATTVANKTMYLDFIWSDLTSKWNLIAFLGNF